MDYYVMCDGKKKATETKRKAINLAKTMASKSISHRSGIYENNILIRTITITDLC
jgi:hypothetical protein